MKPKTKMHKPPAYEYTPEELIIIGAVRYWMEQTTLPVKYVIEYLQKAKGRFSTRLLATLVSEISAWVDTKLYFLNRPAPITIVSWSSISAGLRAEMFNRQNRAKEGGDEDAENAGDSGGTD